MKFLQQDFFLPTTPLGDQPRLNLVYSTDFVPVQKNHDKHSWNFFISKPESRSIEQRAAASKGFYVQKNLIEI